MHEFISGTAPLETDSIDADPLWLQPSVLLEPRLQGFGLLGSLLGQYAEPIAYPRDVADAVLQASMTSCVIMQLSWAI